MTEQNKNKNLSLLFGIISIFTGFLFSILGMIYGQKYRKENNEYSAGYIISVITLLIKSFLLSFIIATLVYIFGVLRPDISKINNSNYQLGRNNYSYNSNIYE